MLTRRLLLSAAALTAVPRAAFAACGCLALQGIQPFGKKLLPPTDPRWGEARRLLSASPTGASPYAVAQYLATVPWAYRHEWSDQTYGNPLIVDLFRDTHLTTVGDTTPWCAAFMNWCLQRADVDGTDCAWAQSFLDWGDTVWTTGQPNLTSVAVPGDVAVFHLNSDHCSGHVAFVDGFQSPRTINVLGGNQTITMGGRTYGAIDVKPLDILTKFTLLSIRRAS